VRACACRCATTPRMAQRPPKTSNMDCAMGNALSCASSGKTPNALPRFVLCVYRKSRNAYLLHGHVTDSVLVRIHEHWARVGSPRTLLSPEYTDMLKNGECACFGSILEWLDQGLAMFTPPAFSAAATHFDVRIRCP